MNQIWLVILGSILALATSFTVELYREQSIRKSLRKNFKTVLKLELKHLLVIIDKLNESYGSKYFFGVGIIDQLDRNIQRFEGIRKDTIYLNEENKKDEILTYFNDLSVFASDIRSAENYAFSKVENETPEASKGRQDFSSKQRQMIALRTVDLKRRGQDIINYTEK